MFTLIVWIFDASPISNPIYAAKPWVDKNEVPQSAATRSHDDAILILFSRLFYRVPAPATGAPPSAGYCHTGHAPNAPHPNTEHWTRWDGRWQVEDVLGNFPGQQLRRRCLWQQSLGDEGGGKQNCAFAPLQKDAAQLETQAWQAAAQHQRFRLNTCNCLNVWSQGACSACAEKFECIFFRYRILMRNIFGHDLFLLCAHVHAARLDRWAKDSRTICLPWMTQKRCIDERGSTTSGAAYTGGDQNSVMRVMQTDIFLQILQVSLTNHLRLSHTVVSPVVCYAVVIVQSKSKTCEQFKSNGASWYEALSPSMVNLVTVTLVSTVAHNPSWVEFMTGCMCVWSRHQRLGTPVVRTI